MASREKLLESAADHAVMATVAWRDRLGLDRETERKARQEVREAFERVLRLLRRNDTRLAAA